MLAMIQVNAISGSGKTINNVKLNSKGPNEKTLTYIKTY